MIAKGNLHAHGAKLAAYLTEEKSGQRAELAEVRGFEVPRRPGVGVWTESELRDVFSEAQLDAEATRCEKPFFHCYVRLPKEDELTREQWLQCADRIEKELGFEDQPRAVAFHHLPDGETHMHLAWSRIDLETERAIDPGLYKNKLKELSRELEQEFDLTRIGSEREPEHKTLAATRNEFEESRRLGTDLRDIRETIRDCLDRSDNGQSFMAALEEEGLTLAKGSRRDFVVIDQEGGLHALGKRITGLNAAEIREQLSDIDREQFLSVEQVRLQKLDRRIELEAEKAAERELGKTAGEIRVAYTLSQTPQEFFDGLEERGFQVARASLSDVHQNEYAREQSAELGKRPPSELHHGEIVIVNSYGSVYFLNQHTTGDSREEINKYLGNAGRFLPSVEQVRDYLIRAKDFVPDPELQAKDLGELRELRTELRVAGNQLRQQLANEELLPTERAALLDKQTELREQQAQVRHAIREIYVAEPARSMPEAREISREAPLESMADRFMSTAGGLADIAGGMAEKMGEGIGSVADSLGGGHSAPTPEMVQARRDAREDAAEAAQARARVNQEDDRQRQIDEILRQMNEREEQYRRLRDNEPGRERER